MICYRNLSPSPNVYKVQSVYNIKCSFVILTCGTKVKPTHMNNRT